MKVPPRKINKHWRGATGGCRGRQPASGLPCICPKKQMHAKGWDEHEYAGTSVSFGSAIVGPITDTDIYSRHPRLNTGPLNAGNCCSKDCRHADD